MRTLNKLLFVAPLAALAFVPARDAAACGGFFDDPNIQQMEKTPVSGHRMIFSLSKTETTLWDQISYTGLPSEFAWVLPIKDQVTIGLSSDALFGNLDADTQVTINSPVIQCAPPPQCGDSTGFAEGSGPGGGSSGAGGVTVTAQQVVGPYETVQLSSADPKALTDWLTMHNYAVPVDIAPVIAAYVKDGFGFLALKLVPGMGVNSMKPVRVTSPGAMATLPLRMVAAGVGTMTPISLWILGEGAYVPTNFPWAVISESQLVWDWTSMTSNYAELRQAAFAATGGKGWVLEASEPISGAFLEGQISDLAMTDPLGSGYADDMGNGAPAAAMADLDALVGKLDPASVWVSRVHAELPRAALATDLDLAASPNQMPISRNLTATKTTGKAPACPVYPPCDMSTSVSTGVGVGAGGASSSTGGTGGTGGAKVDPGTGGGCAVGGSGSSPAAFLGIVLALGLARARRRRA